MELQRLSRNPTTACAQPVDHRAFLHLSWHPCRERLAVLLFWQTWRGLNPLGHG